MRQLLNEFKEFINRGDVVTVAVGLVMALSFKTIIDSLIEGVINPVIAAIIGEPDLAGVGFHLRDSFVSVGLVVNAVIYFVSVSAVLFVVVKAYNRWRNVGAGGDDVPPGPTEVELLTDIRDSLRGR